MNYELIMLNGAKRMKESARDYMTEAKRAAVASFSSRLAVGEQLEYVARIAEESERCYAFVDLVFTALKRTERGYRALITEIYLKKTPKSNICVKYRIARSKLYRVLSSARKSFERELRALGASEKWFWENYGNVEWVRSMKNFVPGKSGRMSA